MKKTSVTSMRVEPPPTVNSVPEPQPPPSCMPRPNMAAPSSTETPTGRQRADHGLPANIARGDQRDHGKGGNADGQHLRPHAAAAPFHHHAAPAAGEAERAVIERDAQTRRR